ncbi:hypothetical protein UUU_04580 [Klebsiella pneumoniae subsp. pneumoniae DSM 30104 = JCM 1662 = NBRC 14940]|nr:hypothetical protein UUU_04580 [Klebsiella pneumoniae subsp. pneumoniae DSM 30104 = JCM 1662 = NBRC 14940]
MAGDILKHSLQMPLGITCLRRHIIQRKRLIQVTFQPAKEIANNPCLIHKMSPSLNTGA